MKSEENQMNIFLFLFFPRPAETEACDALMCERMGAAGGTVKPSAYRARKSAACNM